MSKIIQDYGTTVLPELYINILRGHQYIPQSDQCIGNIIFTTLNSKDSFSANVLEVGCGPGRILSEIAAKNEATFYGVDISESFINFANLISKGRTSYQVVDFSKEDQPIYGWGRTETPAFDVIFMQGVMHHIHGEDRAKFFKRSFDLLKPDGVLIISDEFIKDYESDDDRIMNVAKFYLHIIDEARKGGFDELAYEEAKNLIDDCFSGTKFAGLATEKTFQNIYEYARTINQMFYSYGSVAGLNFDANNQIRNMFTYIKLSVELLTNSSAQNFNRGDLKVSLNVFLEEASLYGFKSQDIYKIGPVDQLGGMGVIVFKKQ